MPDNLLENLNEEQLAAVTHGEGPLMIIAGAGTGKTTAITQRIAWLIEQQKAKPDEVLALTFTEKSATEMEERVDQLLPIGYVDLWISTFHAFCERVLRENALEIGLPDQFNLLDDVDTFLLMRKNLDRFNLDYYKPRGNPTRFIRAMLSHFSRIKDEVVSPDEYLEFAQNLKMNTDSFEGVASEEQAADLSEIERIGEIASAYNLYQQILLENQALDFADLVSYTIELFRKRPKILKKYQDQFKYILVDEFQDTNFAQYELIKLLTKEPYNITVVGDDDQSIYKFRGASLSNIMLFREDFPSAKNIVLNKNYRSRAQILDKAYTLIQQNNPNRLEVKENLNKKLIAHRQEDGQVEHYHSDSIEDEVTAVIEKIIELKKQDDCNWHDFCILTRANDSAEPFLEAMDAIRLPYRFMALSGLYTKPIIIDALAYLRVLDQSHTSPAMYRILSHPILGISSADIAELSLYCRLKGTSLLDAMKLCTEVTASGKSKINDLLLLLHNLREITRRKSASEVFVETIKQSGLLGEVMKLSDREQMEQNDYLQQFFARIKKFEIGTEDKSLHAFLEEFEHERNAGEAGGLKTDIEAGPDVINVMTVHASKGLEFKYVFIINLVEQRFPSTRRSDPIEIPEGLIKERLNSEGDFHIEEERRLFYVALTRAKEGVYLFSADDYGGTRKRKPSRFLSELEIDAKAVERSNVFKSETSDKGQGTEEESTKLLNYMLPPTLSFTQIAAFSTCPLQYKFAHILKIPVFGKHQMSFGKSMHNSMQKIMELQARKFADCGNSVTTEVTELPQILLSEMLRIYEDNWIDEWYPNEEIKLEYFENGKKIITDYYKILQEQKPEVAFLEKGFTLKVRGIAIKGRIDRIDKLEDGYEIIDYKTGQAKTKLEWQDRRQLLLYAMAVEQCFDPPINVKKLTYHYLEDNSFVSFEPKEKDKEKLEKEILDTVNAIKKSDFSAKPGFMCSYCDFKDICEFSDI